MGRISELEEYIKEYRNIRIGRKSSMIEERYFSLFPSLSMCLDSLIKEQTFRGEIEHQDKIRYILFFRLLSSGYTNSGEIAIGMSNAMLYLDDNFSCVYWKPDLVYDGIDKDMEEVRHILCQKFIRLEEYELMHLKQKLLLDDWEVFSKIIGRLTGEITEQLINSSLPLEDELEILYGNYMEQLDTAGKLVGRRKENG